MTLKCPLLSQKEKLENKTALSLNHSACIALLLYLNFVLPHPQTIKRHQIVTSDINLAFLSSYAVPLMPKG